MRSTTRFMLILFLIMLGFSTVSCEDHATGHGGRNSAADLTQPPNRPIAAYQTRLLQIAFQAASAIPDDPHFRERCKTQASVVEATLELGQPQRAISYTRKIDNWRRGKAYADIAYYCVVQGLDHDVTRYLKVAKEVADAPQVEDWRKDRIRVRVASTYALLGEKDEAKQLSRSVDLSEVGKVAAAEAKAADEQAYQERVKQLDALYESGQFDPVRNAMAGFAALFDRFYDDVEKRNHARKRIIQDTGTMPGIIRVRAGMDLIDIALQHSDQPTALALTHQTEELFNAYSWRPDQYVALMGRLVGLRHRSGDEARARQIAEDLMIKYQAARDRIPDIERAGALRPLAQSYVDMNDTAEARAKFQLVLEEGAVNPNARPRALDLCATCLAMAVKGFEPDEAMWAHIRKIQDGLEAPW